MVYRTTKHAYHDGQLEEVSIGPRNEVVLSVRLDPVWNRGGPGSVTIRFGAIRNMREVRDFFEGVVEAPRPGGFLAEVVGIGYEHKGRLVVDLHPHGGIVIESSKMREP